MPDTDQSHIVKYRILKVFSLTKRCVLKLNGHHRTYRTIAHIRFVIVNTLWRLLAPFLVLLVYFDHVAFA